MINYPPCHPKQNIKAKIPTLGYSPWCCCLEYRILMERLRPGMVRCKIPPPPGWAVCTSQQHHFSRVLKCRTKEPPWNHYGMSGPNPRPRSTDVWRDLPCSRCYNETISVYIPTRNSKKNCFIWIHTSAVNPLRPTAIQKLLEIIGRVRLYPLCSFATALDSDINQTTGSGGHLSMWENWCMHAAVCMFRAGQPRSAGDAAKLDQFVGKFLWVTGDPIRLKGLWEFSMFPNDLFHICEQETSPTSPST